MPRVYNFSPGPSTLPEPVLRRAAQELVEYGTTGQSVMEMSHRSPEYEEIIQSCEKRLRSLMAIPSGYKVLFLQGGASMQFSMVPMNLLRPSGKADYIVTGQFAKKAWEETDKLFPGQVNMAGSSEDVTFARIPDLASLNLTPGADYVHICQNNTIFGSRYRELPQTGDVPLVADLSSCILSEPVDVSRYGMIYAGAQKNVAPAGLCLVIIREDLLDRAPQNLPTMLGYRIHADNGSMYNTPPCYPIYIMGLVLEWIESLGGLPAMQAHNERKAAILYDFLDGSDLFRPCVDTAYRSLMNVTFVTGNKELDTLFCDEAKAAGFYNLKGHRVVGGMRASIYNAMPIEGVQKLVAFMQAFEETHRA